MKVIVAGSRTFNDYELLKETLDTFKMYLAKKCVDEPIEIVSGTARGADKMGEQWAKENGCVIHEFKPDWDGLGKYAGYKRNEDMAKFADAAIIFWDGVSKGSKHMIDLAKYYKLKIRIQYY